MVIEYGEDFTRTAAQGNSGSPTLTKAREKIPLVMVWIAIIAFTMKMWIVVRLIKMIWRMTMILKIMEMLYGHNSELLPRAAAAAAGTMGLMS